MNFFFFYPVSFGEECWGGSGPSATRGLESALDKGLPTFILREFTAPDGRNETKCKKKKINLTKIQKVKLCLNNFLLT